MYIVLQYRCMKKIDIPTISNNIIPRISTRARLFVALFVLVGGVFFIHKTSQATEQPSQLLVEMDGEIRFYLTEPNTDRSGTWRMDYDFDSPKLADYSIEHDYQSLVLDSPSNGAYSIETDYRFPGLAHSELTITYINPNIETYVTYQGVVINQNEEHPEFTFNINANDTENPVVFDKTFTTVPFVQVFPNSNNQTLVSWQAPANQDPSFTTYRIYKKQENKDFDYSLVAETTATSYQTSIAWGPETWQPGVISPYTSFVITQVYSDGTESFASPQAYTNDTDQDGLSDEQEIELGTSVTLVDTDDDTLTDYEEINIHATNPLDDDTDGDGFEDNFEISEGTSAIDPNFFPTNDCTVPESGDWYVNSDCKLYENATAPQDIIIGADTTLTLKERIQLFFDYVGHQILIMTGGNIKLEDQAAITQS
jgi:hypothetical protein